MSSNNMHSRHDPAVSDPENMVATLIPGQHAAPGGAGSSAQQQNTASRHRTGVRTTYTRFSEAEQEMLLAGVRFYGAGKWKTILKSYPFHPKRTTVDLKDKYRNILRAIERERRQTQPQHQQPEQEHPLPQSQLLIPQKHLTQLLPPPPPPPPQPPLLPLPLHPLQSQPSLRLPLPLAHQHRPQQHRIQAQPHQQRPQHKDEGQQLLLPLANSYHQSRSRLSPTAAASNSFSQPGCDVAVRPSSVVTSQTMLPPVTSFGISCQAAPSLSTRDLPSYQSFTTPAYDGHYYPSSANQPPPSAVQPQTGEVCDSVVGSWSGHQRLSRPEPPLTTSASSSTKVSTSERMKLTTLLCDPSVDY